MSKKPAKEAPPKAKASAGPGQLTRFQKFEPRRVHRRDLRAAPYNPREIDDFAYARLKKKLETRGLLQALTWNERTGNLVSGHQRLSILDTLEAHDVKTGKRSGKPDDFLLDVDVVRLTLKQEREENVFFNHKGVQGVFDLGKLAELGQLPDFDFEAAGFTEMEIAIEFEGTEYETIFSPEAQAPEVSESMATFGEMAEAGREAEAEAAPHGRMENGEAIRDPEAHAALIAERNRMRDKMAQANEARDPEFFLAVVCRDRAQREALAVALGKDKDTRLIDAAELAHRCKLAL